MRHGYVSAVFFAFAMVGCQKGAVTKLHEAPAPHLPDGWVSHEGRGGFSVAAPANYRLNPAPLVTMGQLGVNDPSTAAPESAPAPREAPDSLLPQVQTQQEKEGLLLVLYDKNVRMTPGEPMTRMFVKKEDPTGTLNQSAKALNENLGSKAEMKLVDLPIGKAAMFRRTETNIGGDQVTDIIFLLVDGDKGYRFTFETTNGNGQFEQDALPIMETVRLKS